MQNSQLPRQNGSSASSPGKAAAASVACVLVNGNWTVTGQKHKGAIGIETSNTFGALSELETEAGNTVELNNSSGSDGQNLKPQVNKEVDLDKISLMPEKQEETEV